MVLLLKQWKSRSSPGFETGASKNPFAMLKKPLSRLSRGGLFVSPKDQHCSVIVGAFAVVGDVEPFALGVAGMAQRNDQFHRGKAQGRSGGRPGDRHTHRAQLPDELPAE